MSALHSSSIGLTLKFLMLKTIGGLKMTDSIFDRDHQQKWSELLAQAVTQPGLVLKAYTAFHGYVRCAI